MKKLFVYATVALALGLGPVKAAEPTGILNVSYDVSRELYEQVNKAFTAAYKKAAGKDITVSQSHAGSFDHLDAYLAVIGIVRCNMLELQDIDGNAQALLRFGGDFGRAIRRHHVKAAGKHMRSVVTAAAAKLKNSGAGRQQGEVGVEMVKRARLRLVGVTHRFIGVKGQCFRIVGGHGVP